MVTSDPFLGEGVGPAFPLTFREGNAGGAFDSEKVDDLERDLLVVALG
jgi:hypothetical protein